MYNLNIVVLSIAAYMNWGVHMYTQYMNSQNQIYRYSISVQYICALNILKIPHLRSCLYLIQHTAMIFAILESSFA